MSIQDLFGKNKSDKVANADDYTSLTNDIESVNFASAKVKEQRAFIPPVDYAKPENFVFYGQAVDYYTKAIEHIHNTYPYDGSLAEQASWRLALSPVDKYVLENEYPTAVGHITMSHGGWGSINDRTDLLLSQSVSTEYISFKGGPHPAADSSVIANAFPEKGKANYYSVADKRTNNLLLSGGLGNTVEFFFKRESVVSNGREVFFDIDNGHLSSSTDYGRLVASYVVRAGENSIKTVYASGSYAADVSFGVDADFTSIDELNDGKWHHYAFRYFNSGSDNFNCELFVDGVSKGSATSDSGSLGMITGSMLGNIGALRAAWPNVPSSGLGWGKLSGSMDEFRFWKIKRSAQDIGRNWITTVGGGSNTDKANVDLGVYYKFNEGTFSTSSTNRNDAVVLDYSGRVSNGSWVGYAAPGRATGSAINEYISENLRSTELYSSESATPIINSANPLVAAYKTAKENVAIEYDMQNNASLLNSIPDHYINDDDETEGNLRSILQIMASYLDNLHMMIKHAPKLHGHALYSASNKPTPFSDRILDSWGLVVPELFVESEVIEAIASRGEKKVFEEEITDVKNAIYQNIYHSLTNIYKKKGTLDSLRNTLRCFGIDEEVVKVNLYSNNGEYTIENKYVPYERNERCLDFHHADRHIGSVYQFVHSTSPANSLSYLPPIASGSSPLASGSAFTMEATVQFPKEQDPNNAVFFNIPFTTSSIAGVYGTSSADPDEHTRPDGDTDNAMLRLYAIRTGNNSRDAHFVLTGSVLGELTSSVYKDVYDGGRWHFVASVYPTRYGNNPLFSGSVLNSDTTGHMLYFSGSKVNQDYVQNSFAISNSLGFETGYGFMTSSKRVFGGADHENFTGSTTLISSDCRLQSLAIWYDKLSDEEIKWHSLDPSNVGRTRPQENFIGSGSTGIGPQLPRANSLALLWTFDNVTGSGASAAGGGASDAKFTVDDVSSGSYTNAASRFGVFSSSLDHFYPALGDFYLANDSSSVAIEYPTAVRLIKPGSLLSSDMVAIGDQDLVYELSTKPTTYYFSAEKSLSNVVSEKIISMFAGVADFNNLIGNPVERYRPEYKSLSKMRQLFFERINDVATTERFIEYYKWIDSAVGTILKQMIPASADFSDGLRTVIESHVLERSKHYAKFARMRFRSKEDLVAAAYGIGEMKSVWTPTSAMEETAALAKIRDVIVKKAAVPKNFIVYDTNSKTAYLHNARGMGSLTLVHDFVGTTASQIVGSSSKALLDSKYENQVEMEGNETFSMLGTRSYAARASNRVSSTASDNLGNYFHTYEVVQLSGRSTNNKWFVEQGGVTSSSNVAYYISGAVDNARRIRSGSKTVFVNRFSAPGGPEVMGESFLDADSAEMSPYNALPWRNLTVRPSLALWLNSHVNQFGYSSLSGTAPAYHKTIRNTRYDGDSASIADGGCVARYDTWAVTHAIPASDRGYAWISSSMQSGTTNCQPFAGFLLNKNEEWQGNAVGFVELDIFMSGGGGNVGGDYWGSNSRIIPTIDVDTNSITAVTGNIADIYGIVPDADFLRFYLNSRTGPWQYATWNQLRSGETDVARKHREKSIISVIDVDRDIIASDSETFVKGKHANTSTNYTEPAFSISYPNRLHMKYADQKASMIYPFEVENVFFANQALNERLDLVRSEVGTHENITSLYESEDFDKIIALRHTQMVFPKGENIGLSRTRDKPNYEEVFGVGVNGYDRGPNDRRKFWDSTPQLRGRSDPSALNSVGKFDVRNGVWPLDSSEGTANEARGLGGELSNTSESFNFNAFFGDNPQPLSTASVLYCHRIEARTETSDDVQPVDIGMPNWTANVEAGRNPWYATYAEFAKDVRPHAQGMSTIPEFRISEHMPYYVDTMGGNFRAVNRKYLQMDGASSSASATTESAAPDETFFKRHAHSDHMVNFKRLDDEHRDLAPLARITLKCKGIKKMRPYNGFYPVQRTVQLAELFSASYGPHIVGGGDEIGTEKEQRRLQALLQPWFAPGILYNSIKAGVSVDWGAYSASSTLDRIWLADPAQNNLPLFGAMRRQADYRFPFESLLEFETSMPPHTASSPDGSTRSVPKGFRSALVMPSHYNENGRQDITYVSWLGRTDTQRYKMGMHNFLAEVPKFFLEDEGLTSIVSAEESKYQPFVAGKTYYMDVALEKTKKFQMIKDPWAAAVNLDITSSCTNDDPSKLTYHGRYFGPALSMSAGDESDDLDSARYAIADPATAQYAPPYLFGKSVARLSFAPASSKNYTVGEILASLVIEERNEEMADRFALIEPEADPRQGASAAWRGRMPLSASIKFDARGRGSDVKFDERGNAIGAEDASLTNKDYWAIYPRFETPILDFSHVEISNCQRGPYGMWINYGREAPRNEGIYMSIASPPASFLSSSGGESLLPMCGFKPASKKLGKASAAKVVSESIVAIPFLDDSIGEADGRDAATVQIGDRHLFSIDSRMFSKQKSNIMRGLAAITAGDFGSPENIESTSISRMIEAMGRYVMPPTFNFLAYDDIPPFAMYFLEFSTTLNRQDLTDIWQGIMPGPAVTAELDEVEFAHDLSEFEFFGGKQPPDGIRWLVFKVKQKAEKNYYAVTEDAFDDARFRFDFKRGDKIPEYSYNWPYDFFSLVEHAKIDVSLDWVDEDFVPLGEKSKKIKDTAKAVQNVVSKGALKAKIKKPPSSTASKLQKGKF